MNQTRITCAQTRTIAAFSLALVALWLCGFDRTSAQLVIIGDPSGDAVIRRTDFGGDGSIDPQTQRLPDVLEMRIGKFTPVAPENDPFIGAWDVAGGFVRFDLVFDKHINPPGPLGWDDKLPVYDPFLYGPNPAYGFIEFDVDVDENTGGELESPQLRYLGNVARFGGLPSEPRFADRAAQDYYDIDQNVTTSPFVERSGEEFHLALLGEEIDYFHVVVEKPGGDPMIFEEGEIWRLEGDLFHRAHGFEDFAFTCIDRPGRYKPEVSVQFAHDNTLDVTTVSLIFPLTNNGAAALIGPFEPVEANDGCEDNQASIEEALVDLQFSAEFANPFDRMLSEFQLISGWEFNTVADHMNPASWQIAGIVGTAYGVKQSGTRFVWSDVYPNPRIGDVDGNGLLNDADVMQLNNYIASFDGNPQYDDDGNNTNGSIDWHNYAKHFCVFDTNYDGFVDGTDAIVAGDMDLSQVVDPDDVDDFIVALLDPDAYESTHGGADPCIRGDLNGDSVLNGGDIVEFINLLLNP